MIFFITFLVTLVMFYQLYKKINTKYLVLRCLTLMITAIPPELPAALILGISITFENLLNKGIYCIDPYSIISGGNV